MTAIGIGDNLMNNRNFRFGTDGLRGEVGTELLATDAFILGAGLSEVHGGRLRVCIGMDTRLSSPMLAAALISGLLASGSEVHTLGVLPTPAIAYLTDRLSFDIGIAVTASHNPFSDNGIKLFRRGGEKCSDSIERRLEEYLSGKKTPKTVSGGEIGRIYNGESAVSLYLDFLTSRFSGVGTGISVGLDAANGAAYKTAKSILEYVGCKVTAMGTNPNGLNINAKVGALHTEALASLVKRDGLDIGFALDGDGDRCIAVTSRGEIVDGDGILYAMAKYKKSKGVLKNDGVAVTVTSNGALLCALGEMNIRTFITPVGDKEVSARMKREDISLGAESSGHIIDADIFPIGDGTATALSILSIISDTGNSLSSLIEGFSPFPSVCRAVAVKNKESVLLSDSVLEAKRRAEALIGDDGRILLRASGTEEKIRILAECSDHETCKMAAEIIEKAVLLASY